MFFCLLCNKCHIAYNAYDAPHCQDNISLSHDTYLSCIIRNDEAPNIVLLAMAIGAVINVFGDWFLVFPMQMGMKGSAIATIVGSIVQALLCWCIFFRPTSTLRLVKPHHWLSAFKQITISGFGSSFLSIAAIITTVILNNQIMKYSGANALAVYGGILSFATIYQGIFSGVGSAAQPIMSVNFADIIAIRPHASLTAYSLNKLTYIYGKLFIY